jgi:ECF transporter S component (folate family)
MALTGFLYGPVVAMGAGAVCDVLSFFLNPTGGSFFPGFTLNAILGGLIYGMVLYQKPNKLWRAFVAKALVNLLLNVALGTLWLTLLYGNPYFVIVPARLIKNLVLLPIEAPIIYLVCGALQRAIPSLVRKPHLPA